MRRITDRITHYVRSLAGGVELAWRLADAKQRRTTVAILAVGAFLLLVIVLL